MLQDRVSNPGPLIYDSGALPIALRGPASEGYQQTFFRWKPLRMGTPEISTCIENILKLNSLGFRCSMVYNTLKIMHNILRKKYFDIVSGG